MKEGDFVKGIRAIVKEEIKLDKERQNKERGLQKQGTEWTSEEEDHLIGEFKASIVSMARFHKRSEIAIAYKLGKLHMQGKLENLKYTKTWKGDE